jgi:maltose O-acetyltransferase
MFSIFKQIILRLRGEISTERLIKMGLKVGKNFNRQMGCNLDYGHCWLITIGENVTLAPHVKILAHDASTKHSLGYTKIGLVNIGNNVFIGMGSIVLPNVTIGDNVIIGAGSVVTKNIPSGSIAAGNPAKVFGMTNDYLAKNKEFIKVRPTFDETWTISSNISKQQKHTMIEKLKDGIGFVV